MSQEGVPPGGLIPQPGDPVPTPRTPAGEPVRANRRDGPRPPTYQGSGLPLGGGSATRERNWEAMSAKIRERLAELAGDVLEWFAEHDPSSSDFLSSAGLPPTPTLFPTTRCLPGKP